MIVRGRNGKKRSKSRTLSDVAAQSHAQNLTMLVMEADSDNNRSVETKYHVNFIRLVVLHCMLHFDSISGKDDRGTEQRGTASSLGGNWLD